jgi:putative transcriptional regulator
MFRLKIKKIAEAKGYTYSSLADAVDEPPIIIWRIFQNPHKEVTITLLEKIAQALGVRMGDLFEELPDPPVEKRKK